TASSGALDARTDPGQGSPDPCQPSPGSPGFQGPENQLYRVEIHQGGDRTQARFNWSRDNGSVVTAVTAVNGPTLTVRDLGRDEQFGFAKDDWVEVADEVTLLGGGAGVIAQIDSVSPTSPPSITLKTPVSPDVSHN